MSKRIMSEVMCIADDIELHIEYQDTVSMRIVEHGIKTLPTAYNIEYGRELIGKDMNCFHCDFINNII